MAYKKERKRIAFDASELPVGARKVVTVGRREILVLNVDATLYAIFNRCPHQQATFEDGPLGGTNLPSPVGEWRFGLGDQVLACPWHRYQFDLNTGRCLADPERLRVATYEAVAEGDEIAIYV
jgi:nitrite reductase/ring-hydroxylating ferredoxin subunit